VEALYYYSTVSQNVTNLSCYNSDIHESIWMTTDKHVTEKVCNQNVLYFPPHLSNASALRGEIGNRKLHLFT